MSGPTDTHDLAAGCINLDDHRLKQPRGLTGQSSAKRYPPDSACVRRREQTAGRTERRFLAPGKDRGFCELARAQSPGRSTARNGPFSTGGGGGTVTGIKSVKTGGLSSHPATVLRKSENCRRVRAPGHVRQHLFPGELAGSLYRRRRRVVPDPLQIRMAPRGAERSLALLRGLTSDGHRCQRHDRDHGR